MFVVFFFFSKFLDMQSWLHLQANLALLDDPYYMLGMCCIIPLLEGINFLCNLQNNVMFSFVI